MSITLIIVIVTAAFSIIGMNNRDLFAKYLYSPYQVYHRKQYYRSFTHAFLHSGWIHLLVNMYVLFMFGKTAEKYFIYYQGSEGLFSYVLLYVGGILFATLPALRKHKDDIMYNSVGASGAVSTVLFASIVFSPTMEIRFIFLPIPIPAVIFGILYLFYEAYMDKKADDYVAHDAHYYGAIFGAIFTFIAVPDAFVNFFNQLAAYFT